MAACAASENGAATMLLEKMPRPGRKLMITGKGRCNFTNLKPWEAFSGHIRSNPRFVRPAFYNFTPEDAIAFIERQGVPVDVERGDRAFPHSYRATDIIDALVRAARTSGVDIRTGEEVTAIVPDPSGEGFLISCRDNRTFSCLRLIIATGGLSYPRTGSTGDGYRWAEAAGHSITPLFPSLTALVPKGYKTDKLSTGKLAAKVLGGGIAEGAEAESSLPKDYPGAKGWIDRAMPLSELGSSLCGVHLRNVSLTLYNGKDRIGGEFGEMDFTDGGIEGPVAFSLSRDAVKAITNGGKVSLLLDLKPEVSEDELLARLKSLWTGIASDSRSRGQNARTLARVMLGKVMPRELVAPFSAMNPSIVAGGRLDLQRLARALKEWTFEIEGFVGYERCVVTAGGIDTSEVLPKTMESRLCKGMYFCGEVLDIDSDTGGYNIQTALSTGRLAGESAARSL